MKGTKRLAVLAMFTAIALTIFVAEAQIPPIVPIPGVKLGLANIVTLIAMALLGRRQAGEILLVRIVLGSVFTGGVSAMLFSIAGGVLAYLIMCLTIRHSSGAAALGRECAGSLRAQCRAAAGRRLGHGDAVHSGVCARARRGKRGHRGVHRCGCHVSRARTAQNRTFSADMSQSCHFSVTF